MTNVSKERNSEVPPFTSSPKRRIKVRWMTSGSVSCTVEVGSKCKVANLMAQVEEKIGIPVEEQNLFLGPKELLAIEGIAGVGSDDVKLVRAKNDPRTTNLASFHKHVTVNTLEIGQFTYLYRIGQGKFADVCKYSWHPASHKDCMDVAVKKVSVNTVEHIKGQETNEHKRHMELRRCAIVAEDPLGEIGILQFLAAQQDVPDCLLQILAAFADEWDFWIVTEFADGGDLFDVALQGAPTEYEIFGFMLQVFRALAYLHEHYIGHRDVSLENLVLKNGTVKLMDFGAAVRSHSASGQVLRYFSKVGKDCYRAPECYVPHMTEVTVVVPSSSTPDSVAMVTLGNRLVQVHLAQDIAPGNFCAAEVWGYSVPPADMFAAGVCLFMLLFKTNAFSIATLEDPGFHRLHFKQEEGLKETLQGWNIPVPSKNTSQLLCGLLASSPSQRPSAAECLTSSCFNSIHEHDVHTDGQPICFPTKLYI